MTALLEHRHFIFIRNVLKHFIANQGILNAAALTYTTLFAVVPLMTVSYAMLAAIPSFQGVGEQLQGWIFENFVPSTGAVVQDYLSDFASQARSLTAVGVAVLAITSIMMMKNIEAAFNRIWRVSEPRKGLSSFLLYWAVLSLGPLLIGLGLVLSSYIASLSLISSATEAVGRGRLLSIFPIIMSSAAFGLLYMAVPNCRVPFKSAFIGGVVVACLFEAAKRGFAFFVTQFPSYELIYGAFAAFPLFLMWIFLSWIIMLLGAELTRSLTIYSRSSHNASEPHLYTMVAVLYRLWLAQNQGQVLSDQTLLKEVKTLNQGRWDSYQQLLFDNGIIQRTDKGHYLLCRDLGNLSLYQLNDLLPWPMPMQPQAQLNQAWQKLMGERLAKVGNTVECELDLCLESLFNEKA